MKKLMDEVILTSQECCKEIEIGEVAMTFKREVENFQNVHSALVSLSDSHIGQRQWDDIRKIILSDKNEKDLKELGIKEASELFKK